MRKLTPIMGWASWNCFSTNISEGRLLEQARALIDTGLRDCGYEYVNMDDGFFGGRAQDGTLLFHKERFPNGIKPVADAIHAMGLKAGTYSDGGDSTCAYTYNGEGPNGYNVGLYGHEERDLRMYMVDCGYDFIKVDWCGGLRLGLDDREQYTKISRIIETLREETGKPLVYNICRWQFPGPWAAQVADSWRTASDIAPNFDSVLHQIDNIKPLAKFAGPGHVNDLDMMQLGNGMNEEEERTHFAMWCLMSTPLIIGCDLTKIAPSTLQTLKNRELIALNQDAACQQAYVVKEFPGGEIWVKELSDENRRAVAILNRSEGALDATLTMQDCGFNGKIHAIRDVIHHEDVAVTEDIRVTVPYHGVQVYVIDGEGAVHLPDLCAQDVNDPADVPHITLEEALRLQREGAILVDVRTWREYGENHLSGAINLEYTDIHGFAPRDIPDRSTPIVLYCRTGKRSMQVLATLVYLGYTNVYYLGGVAL